MGLKRFPEITLGSWELVADVPVPDSSWLFKQLHIFRNHEDMKCYCTSLLIFQSQDLRLVNTFNNGYGYDRVYFRPILHKCFKEVCSNCRYSWGFKNFWGRRIGIKSFLDLKSIPPQIAGYLWLVYGLEGAIPVYSSD